MVPKGIPSDKWVWPRLRPAQVTTLGIKNKDRRVDAIVQSLMDPTQTHSCLCLHCSSEPSVAPKVDLLREDINLPAAVLALCWPKSQPLHAANLANWLGLSWVSPLAPTHSVGSLLWALYRHGSVSCRWDTGRCPGSGPCGGVLARAR